MSMPGTASVLIAYLLGSIPFGYLLFRTLAGGDIRQKGSGNIGATNAFRAGGRAIGVATLLLDVLKGLAAVALSRWMTGDPVWQAAAAFAAVAGHCYPFTLRFRGGKGIATGGGAYGLAAPLPMLVAVGLFAVTTALTRMVSLGSIVAGLSLPVLVMLLQPDRALVVSSAAAAVLVVTRHHANIRRILAGEENRIRGS